MALLQSRTALITEATTALGLAIAERFVKEGASLFLCSPQQSALEASLVKLEPLLTKGQRILTQRVDSASRQSIAQLLAFCADRFQRLDYVLSPTSRDPLTQQLIARMKQQQSGKLIILSGSEPIRALSLELAPFHIDANAIHVEGPPAQTAELAVFLASTASNGISGTLYSAPRRRLPDPV